MEYEVWSMERGVSFLWFPLKFKTHIQFSLTQIVDDSFNAVNSSTIPKIVQCSISGKWNEDGKKLMEEWNRNTAKDG